jgi:hypothetical protein
MLHTTRKKLASLAAPMLVRCLKLPEPRQFQKEGQEKDKCPCHGTKLRAELPPLYWNGKTARP